MILVFLFAPGLSRAACPGCTAISSPIVWGTTSSASLDEASGLAVSTHNPGVIWTHNDDGNEGRMFAFSTNGALLAVLYHGLMLSDVEDMAQGPGPVAGVSYLYLGDIGGGGGVRSSVKVLRAAEPAVLLSWAGAPQAVFPAIETFTLQYPDGSFDAETLMLDPVTADVFIGTKQNGNTRIYRANLNSAANGATLVMEFVIAVPFGSTSGGSISANGGRIALRREEAAEMWIRCEDETVGSALSRPGWNIPVVGPPTEPNGEAIAFLPDGSGYLTISDRTSGTLYQPPLYFFPALCSLTAVGTDITQQPQSTQVEPASDVQLSVVAAGTNLTYQWRFQNADIPGANSSVLLLTNVQPANSGAYTVLVSGDGGSALSSPANVSVRILPPVIVAQPQTTLAPTGSTAQLTVAVQGTAPFSFQWSRNGRAVPGTGATLSLTNVQRTNSGKYRVVVTNSAGKATSAFAQLKVLNPPVIVINPQPKTVLAGQNAVLRARATGSLPLRYQWLFNGMPLTNGLRAQLVLRRVQAAQAGDYSVVVTNAVGTAVSSAAVLTVQ